MPKYRLYLATPPGAPTEPEQEAAFPGLTFDEIIVEETRASGGTAKAWQYLIPHLGRGDHVALHGLNLLPLQPTALNKVLFDLLEAGVTIHLAIPPLVITPVAEDPAAAMVRAYEAHRRALLGRTVTRSLKAAPRTGRPSRITADMLPEIQRMLRDPALSHEAISKKLQVSRSTLYKFMARHRISPDPVE